MGELTDDYRMYLEEKFKGVHTQMENVFTSINLKLEGLNNRMDIANGRTTKNENGLKDHIESCPMKKKSEVLEKELADYSFLKRHPSVAVGIVVVAVIVTMESIGYIQRPKIRDLNQRVEHVLDSLKNVRQ